MELWLFDSQQFLKLCASKLLCQELWEYPTARKCWHLTLPSTPLSSCPCRNSSLHPLVWLHGRHLLNVLETFIPRFPWGHGVTELQSSIFRVEPCDVLVLWHNFSRSPGDSLLLPNPVTLRFQKFLWWLKPTYEMWEAAFVPVVFAHMGCLVSAAASTGTVPPHPGLA